MIDDPRVLTIPTPAELRRWDLHRYLRTLKGRPATRATYTQFVVRDGKLRGAVKTLHPDPILELFVARRDTRCLSLTTGQRERAHRRYGYLRQTVVSPLDRPLP